MRVSRMAAAAIAAVPLMAGAAESNGSIEARLRALEERQTQLEKQLIERDAQIQQLQSQLKAATAGTGAVATVATQAPAAPPVPSVAAPANAVAPAPAAPVPVPLIEKGAPSEEHTWGRYEGGKGVVIARSDSAEVDFSVFTYIRYLNQKALDDTYTDAFDRTKTLDLRQDVQFQKVTLNFKGWLFNPDFRYLFYTWTSNTSQGQSAQVVVAGNLSYHFNDAFSLAGGIGALPSTRSTNYTFPNWLRVDNRTIADEFFRGS